MRPCNCDRPVAVPPSCGIFKVKSSPKSEKRAFRVSSIVELYGGVKQFDAQGGVVEGLVVKLRCGCRLMPGTCMLAPCINAPKKGIGSRTGSPLTLLPRGRKVEP